MIRDTKNFAANVAVLIVEITCYKIYLKKYDKQRKFLSEVLRMMYLMSVSSGHVA